MHLFRLYMCLLLLLLCGACTVILAEKPGSAELNKGFIARDEAKPEKAADYYKQAINKGQHNDIKARALRELGLAHLRGEGVKANEAKGIAMLKEADALGDRHALTKIERYKKRKAKQAAKAARKARKTKAQSRRSKDKNVLAHLDKGALVKEAENGNAEAMRRIGHMVRLDGKTDEAREWYFKAASAGDAQAQYIVGMALLTGDGVEIDEPQAREWLARAQEQGYTGDAEALSGWGTNE